MYWHLAAIVALLACGCLGTPGQDGLQEVPQDADLAGSAPFFVDGVAGQYMHDCQQAVLILHVSMDRLRAALPDGYEPIPAEAQYAQLTPLPRPPVAPSGDGWLFVEAHGCAPSKGGMPHVDVNVQIAVEAADRDEGRPFATVLAYELGRASNGGPFHDAYLELGVPLLGDEVRVEITDEGPFRTATAQVRLAGSDVLSFEFPMVAENPIEVDDAYGRVWTHAPGGTLTFGWDAGEHVGDAVNAYVGGAPPACSFAPGTLVADLLGVTTCTDARAAGVLTVPLMPETHDMNLTWEILPGAA